MPQCEIDVDCFAGGGGASVGIERATGQPVRVAINHDPQSIAVHRANHPHTKHYINDIWSVRPGDIVAGHGPIRLLWLSPDCTYFSRAKGSAPIRNERGQRSRDLAWVAVEWARHARPRIIMLENVEEFCAWSPLDERGRPCAARKGETFALWLAALRHAGYRIEWRYLHASDYGAPTSRKRLFLIARRDQRPIRWPEPTHGPGLAPYRSAGECIDWGTPGHSIFLDAKQARKAGCKRPLAEATMRRVAQGAWRYVIDADDPFIAPAIACEQPGEGLLCAPWFVSRYGERAQQTPRTRSVERPAPTIVPTGNGASLVIAWLAQHNTGLIGHDAREPLSTIVGKGCTQGLVTAQLARKGLGEDENLIAFPVRDAHRQGRVRELLERYRDARPGTRRRSTAPSGDPTIVALRGEDYDMIDVTMRMLKPRELYTAQGFPQSYIIDPIFEGAALSKRAQTKHCGNAVCPQVPEALVRANLAEELADTREYAGHRHEAAKIMNTRRTQR